MLFLILVGLGIVAALETVGSVGTRRVRALALGIGALLGVALLVRGDFGNQKLAGKLLMPAGLFWMALFARVAWEALRRRGSAALVSGLLFIAYTLAGSIPLGAKLVRNLELPYPTVGPEEAPFEAIIVLGGGTNIHRGEPELGPSGDRLRAAAELWHRGQVQYLVTTGRSRPPFGEGDLSAHTQQLWEDMGIPAQAVIRLPGPVNTKEELRATATLIRERGWRRVGLLTSAWHLGRALGRARAQGLDLIPIPSNHRGGGPHLHVHPMWYVPQSEGFLLMETAAWEGLGRAVGR